MFGCSLIQLNLNELLATITSVIIPTLQPNANLEKSDGSILNGKRPLYTCTLITALDQTLGSIFLDLF